MCMNGGYDPTKPIREIDMRLIMVLLLSLSMGCASKIVRDKTAVTAEINFTNNLVKSEAQAIEELMKMHCACEDGKWTTVWCHNAADVYAVYIDRWEWHLKMTKHLSLGEERPTGNPPEIRSADDLCGAFESVEGSD